MNDETIAFETPFEIGFRTVPEVLAAFNDKKIFFGRDVGSDPHGSIVFPKTITVEPYTSFPGRHLFECGAFSYSETIAPLPRLKVGRYCSIAYGLEIFGVRHPIDRVTTSSITYDFFRSDGYLAFNAAHRDLLGQAYLPSVPADIEAPFPIIENDVWVGQNVQLARGIRIGTGSVIAAGSVVTRDVAPYTIVAGVPARVIKRRFPEDLSERLLASRWWDHHPDYLFRYGHEDPEAFIDRFEGEKARGALTPYSPVRLGWTAITDLVSPRTVIECGHGLADPTVLASGWSQPEDGFTWAVGGASVLRLPAATLGQAGGVTLEMFAMPTHAQRLMVSVRTAAGAVTLSEQRIERDASISFTIAANMLIDDAMVIDLVHPDFICPVALGLNADPRELSVGIRRIGLH